MSEYKLVPCDFKTAQGDSKSFSLKVRIYDDGHQYYEVRRVLIRGIASRSKLNIAKFVGRELLPVDSMLVVMGFNVSSQCLPSWRMLHAKGIQVTDDMKNEKEMVCSTLYLLLSLGLLADTRRDDDEKHTWKDMLASWSGATVGSDGALNLVDAIDAFPSKYTSLCSNRVQNGHCVHIRNSLHRPAGALTWHQLLA